MSVPISSGVLAAPEFVADSAKKSINQNVNEKGFQENYRSKFGKILFGTRHRVFEDNNNDGKVQKGEKQLQEFMIYDFKSDYVVDRDQEAAFFEAHGYVYVSGYMEPKEGLALEGKNNKQKVQGFVHKSKAEELVKTFPGIKIVETKRVKKCVVARRQKELKQTIAKAPPKEAPDRKYSNRRQGSGVFGNPAEKHQRNRPEVRTPTGSRPVEVGSRKVDRPMTKEQFNDLTLEQNTKIFTGRNGRTVTFYPPESGYQVDNRSDNQDGFRTYVVGSDKEEAEQVQAFADKVGLKTVTFADRPNLRFYMTPTQLKMWEAAGFKQNGGKVPQGYI